MAANIRFADYAVAQLASAVVAATGIYTINLLSGQGALFPNWTGAEFSFLTLADAATNGATTHEVVKATARVGDVLTVTRGGAWPDSTPASFAANDYCQLRYCSAAAQYLADLTPGA